MGGWMVALKLGPVMPTMLRLRKSGCFSISQKMMWGMKPLGWAPLIRERISFLACSGSRCSRARAWKQESQNHWKG